MSGAHAPVDERWMVVALLRIQPGRAETFLGYEAKACAIAARHGGRLERRVTGLTAGANYDEVHVWYFRDRASFAAYRADPELLALAELRAHAIADTLVLEGQDAFRHFLNPLAAVEGERVGVFHIASEPAWQAAQHTGMYRHASLAEEGFIHCSTRPQVLATADRYFRGMRGLVLLRLDAVRLGGALRYEAPRAPERTYELFPHLYGPLPVDAVLSVHPLPPSDDGTFAWPAGA